MEEENNTDWYIYFLFFLMTEDKETFWDLITAENFDEKYNELIKGLTKTDAEVMKQKCLEMLKEKKDVFANLNKAYRDNLGGTLNESLEFKDTNI